MPFFDMANCYASEMRRILIADVNGVLPNNSARTDIKMDTGYIFEVDLEYSDNIHKRDEDYSLAPEVIEITTDML